MSATLAARDEDNVALARVGIVVLEDEELVDAVLLESRDLDDGADGPYEAAIKDDVLLATDLQGEDNQLPGGRAARGFGVDGRALLTPSSRYSRSLRALLRTWSMLNSVRGAMVAHRRRGRELGGA